MCGLFGFNHFDLQNKTKADEALELLAHRGPDQSGRWYDEDVYLGHRRLSILDLSDHGRQPLLNKEESVIICVNGEIYNYKELKAELGTEFEFTSGSDSEVVLYGYIKWGIEGLIEKIDGMYAIVIYDKFNGRLYLVRDRVGIKPLYYSLIDGRLVWASELKSIEHFIGKENLDVDRSALYDFLTYLYIPAPKTIYQNVYKLEPAHYIETDVKNSCVETKRYWSLNVDVKSITPADASVALKRVLKQSIKEQLVSDVPVGFFLSGGMDSSAIVSVASKLGVNVKTFTVGFDDKNHDESNFAKMVADQYSNDHKTKILSKNYFKSLVPMLRAWYDEPFADTSAFPSFSISEFAKREVSVVLTGDGGDELFGGYNWYRTYQMYTRSSIRKYVCCLNPLMSHFKKMFHAGVISRLLARIERQFLLSDFELYTKLMGGMIKSEKTKYSNKWSIPKDYDDYWYFRKYYKEDLPLLTRLQYMDFHTYLPDDILTKVDRVSMAVSLECRIPFLSKDVVEFAFSLPEEVRYASGDLKGILKLAFKDELPKEIIDRGKKGFSIPSYKKMDLLAVNGCTRQETILMRYFSLESDV